MGTGIGMQNMKRMFKNKFTINKKQLFTVISSIGKVRKGNINKDRKQTASLGSGLDTKHGFY